MKHNLSILIAVMGLQLFFCSCKIIPDPSVTLLQITLSEDFEIQTDSSDNSVDSVTFEARKSFDPNSNADFFSNRSKFAELTIDKLKYRVKSIGFQTADSLIEGKFELLNPATSQFETLAEDFNRKLIAGQEVEVNLNPAGKASLEKLLTSASPQFEIRMMGKMNKRPIHLILAPEIKLSVKTKI